MKRGREFIEDWVRPFLKDHICVAIFSVIFFTVYKNVSGVVPTLLFIVFVILYTTTIGMCDFGMTKLEGYERTCTLTPKRLSWLSVFIGAPIYLLWFAFSFIPIAHYAVWFLTGLPLCVITGTTLTEVAARWKEKKLFYWAIQVVIYLVFLLIGQWSVHQLFF